MLPNGVTGRVVLCKGVLYQKSKYEMNKITNYNAIKLC